MSKIKHGHNQVRVVWVPKLDDLDFNMILPFMSWFDLGQLT